MTRLKDVETAIRKNKAKYAIGIGVVFILILSGLFILQAELPFVAVSPDIEATGVTYGSLSPSDNTVSLDYATPGHRGDYGLEVYQTHSWNYLNAPETYNCGFFWHFYKDQVKIADIQAAPTVHFFLKPNTGSSQLLTIGMSFYIVDGSMEISSITQTITMGSYAMWNEHSFRINDFSGAHAISLAKIHLSASWGGISTSTYHSWFVDDLYIGSMWDNAFLTVDILDTGIAVGGTIPETTETIVITDPEFVEGEKTEGIIGFALASIVAVGLVGIDRFGGRKRPVGKFDKE